jgi:hypothetical protein
MSEKQADFTDFMDDKNASAIRVPDLDWLALSDKDVKNIPVPMNIEIIPQLQENWKRTGEASATLIPNSIRSEETAPSDKITEQSIRDVVMAAKKEMMNGSTGKALATKLAALYPKNLIKAAKEDLIKLANEQGLLGKVYVDISPYDSCEEAARLLGPSRIRLAKFVVGKPRRHICSSHLGGYCKELRKSVVEAMDYNKDILADYTTHLRTAGMIGPEDVIDSKDMLRSALLKAAESKMPKIQPIKESTSKLAKLSKEDALKVDNAFANHLMKEAMDAEGDKERVRFMEARPFIAFIQDEMLKGKIGNSLKESVLKRFAPDIIQKFSNELRKVASLQGLMGNLYVDVSYYDSPEDAVRAIKTASTNPNYIMQSVRLSDFDDTLRRVASKTGCTVLPRDGKIDSKIASSYIDDLQFTQRISSDQAEKSRKRIASGDNVLKVLKDTYASSINYKRPVKVGGVQASFYQEPTTVKHTVDRGKLKEATYKAVEAGFSIDKIETKLAAQIPTAEAVGLVRGVVASVKEIDANVLDNCSTDKYQISLGATIKKASKCAGCVMSTDAGCLKQGFKFTAAKKVTPGKEKPMVGVDPKTEKVELPENPDEVQKTIQEEFDLPPHGSLNINIDLDNMRSYDKDASFDIGFSTDGIDLNLETK